MCFCPRERLGSGLGVYSDLWKAQIGGFFWNGPEAHKKRYSNECIFVHRFKWKRLCRSDPNPESNRTHPSPKRISRSHKKVEDITGPSPYVPLATERA